MKALLCLALKDLRVLSRDRFALFWIFAFPLMFALFFGAIFGGSDEGGDRARVSLAIVDEERTPDSARLVEALRQHESLRVARVPASGPKDVDGEDAEIGAEESVRLDTLEEARAAVRRGEALAYLRIPRGFDLSPFELFGGGNSSDATHLEIGLDPSRSAEAGFLQGILMETIFGGLSQSFTDPERMTREVSRMRQEVFASDELSQSQRGILDSFLVSLEEFSQGMDSNDMGQASEHSDDSVGLGSLVQTVDVTRETGQAPRSAFEITFPSSVLWGVMSVALGFAVTLVRERSRGTLLRLRIAPISRAQLIGGKALACFTACLIVMGFLLAFGVVILGVRVESPFLALMGMVCTAFCFTGLMMTISVLGRTEQAVAGASWGLMMPFAMIGGGMIPLIAMPPWLASLSNLSFFKWGILSLEGAIWRGFMLGDMLLPCGILLLTGALFFGIGLGVFRRLDG